MSDEVENGVRYLGQPEATYDAVCKRLRAAEIEIEILRAAIIQYVNAVWEHEGVTFIEKMPDENLQKVIAKLMNPYFVLGEKE